HILSSPDHPAHLLVLGFPRGHLSGLLPRLQKRPDLINSHSVDDLQGLFISGRLENQERLLRLIGLTHLSHGAKRQLIEARQLNVLAVESVVKLVWILLYSHLCASNKTIMCA